MTEPALTVLNVYALKGTAADFRAAISALAARVLRDGHKGVLSYRFFVSDSQPIARAVIDYADAAAWIGHHEIAMGWPEMTALHKAAALQDITFLGEVPTAITDWLATSGLKADVHGGYSLAAGFRRD